MLKPPRRALALGLVAFSLALAAGCGEDGAADLPAGVVARVGDASITQEQLDRAVAQSKAEVQQQGGTFPTADSAQFDQVRQQALENLRLERIVEFEARKCGKPCRVEGGDVDDELARIVETNFNGSEKQLTTFLTQTGRSQDDARKLVRSQLEQRELFDHITRGVRFSAADARRYYEENPAEFRTPAGRSAKHILVKTKAEADRIRAQATPQNFGGLARRFSTDQGSKGQGGELGPLQRGQLVPEFEKAAFALGDGEISQPVKTQFGWHVILVDTTPARVTPFAQARAGIVSTQLQAKRQAEFTKWRDGVIEGWTDRTVYANESLGPPSTTAGAGATAPQGAPPPTSTTP